MSDAPDAHEQTRQAYLREAEAFDPGESSYGVLIELAHAEEPLATQARALLMRFFQELEGG